MSLSLGLQLALKSLRQHRLRSVLTLLGVTIGVAVVIVMAAIAAGARQSIAQQIRAAGANMIQVSAGNYSQGDQDPGSGDVAETTVAGGAGTSPEPIAHASRAARARGARGDGWAGQGVSPRLPGRGASMALQIADVAAIGQEVDGVRLHSAGVTDTAVIASGQARLLVRLQGGDVDYQAIRAFTVQRGRFFDTRQVVDRSPVLVLSAAAAGELFGAVDPIGRSVEIRRKAFLIVGVVEKSGGLAAGSKQPEVFLPYTAAQDLLGITHLHAAAVSIERAGDATRVARDIIVLLRTRHGLGPDDADDFTVKTQAREAILGKGVNPLVARAVAGSVVNLDQVTLAEIAESLERSGRTMTLLLAGVAGIALLVGGIGIMNIMLVSVTERTREIGLRLAVGATGRDVMVQFLAEAVTLSLAGGVIGIVIGAALSGGVGRLLRWSTTVSPASVVAAAGVAALVGVFFGFYPARQASRLDPIVALRHE
jgi:putative ABC transport system permease protein